jgi:hypothetical protein
MAFDVGTSCVIEETFQLPACLQGDPDTLKLHAAISKVTTYLQDHWIPKDPFDVPYVYRTAYLPDYVTANDSAALGRIMRQAVARGISLPVLLGPLVASGPDVQVTPDDVVYVAANAGPIADAMDPLLTEIQAVDAVTPPPATNWLFVTAVVAGALLLGAAIAGAYTEHMKDRRAA